MRRGILKRAITDLQRRGGGWTSKCDNIRGTRIIMSLKRDETVEIGWLTWGPARAHTLMINTHINTSKLLYNALAANPSASDSLVINGIL